MTLGKLVDLYLSDLARVKRPNTVKTYNQTLSRTLSILGENAPIESLREEDCLRVLDFWRNCEKSTQAFHHTVLNRLFLFAHKRDWMSHDPMKNIDRPRVPNPEDKEVTIVSTAEVLRMFQACESWADEACLGLISQTGVRRNAASRLRWRDVNFEPDPPDAPFGWMRFEEKGGKKPWKPIPQRLREILDRAPEHSPDDYVIPNYNPELIRGKERSNTIIYHRVKRIAERAGVEAHVHSLRAEFAVFFLENNPKELFSLQTWLGHESIETTRGYLRGVDQKRQLARGLYLDRGALSEGAAVSGKPTAEMWVETEFSAPAPSESAFVSRQENGQEQLVAHNLLSGAVDSGLDQLERELYPDVLGALLARQPRSDKDTKEDILGLLSATMAEKETGLA